MDRVVTVDDHELKLTHLEKRFWEPEGYTKLDMIGYYSDVAKVLVPHLQGRPESLKRHPDGAAGKSFFQKNMKDVPPWAETVTIGETRYLVSNDTAGLLYMANLGCIEINPWLSRVGRLDRPDFLVMDLDPLEISFDEVIHTAQTVKQVLDEVGLPGYPKTSGASGLHVYIPVARRYTYREVVGFAEVLAILVHRRLPHTTSLERLPKKRVGRVYLDYLQNGEGKTMAAAYSLRAEPGAPVSTPLYWEEVKKGLRPTDFHLGNMRDRIAKVGDLFAPVLGEGVDLRPLVAAERREAA